MSPREWLDRYYGKCSAEGLLDAFCVYFCTALKADSFYPTREEARRLIKRYEKELKMRGPNKTKRGTHLMDETEKATTLFELRRCLTYLNRAHRHFERFPVYETDRVDLLIGELLQMLDKHKMKVEENRA